VLNFSLTDRADRKLITYVEGTVCPDPFALENNAPDTYMYPTGKTYADVAKQTVDGKTNFF